MMKPFPRKEVEVPLSNGDVVTIKEMVTIDFLKMAQQKKDNNNDTDLFMSMIESVSNITIEEFNTLPIKDGLLVIDKFNEVNAENFLVQTVPPIQIEGIPS